MIKKITILASFLFGVINLAFAQNGKVKGQITDEAGEAVIGAGVFIEYGSQRISALTDLDGKYILNPVPTGKHKLYVSYLGKIDTIKGINVSTDKVTFKNYTMGAITTMDTTIVYGDQIEIDIDASTSFTLDYKTIENSPNLRNPVELITNIGNGITETATGEISFRGARANDMLTFVDGVRTRGLATGIPARAIYSYKVYVGGLPAKYGDTNGGVVEIETKTYFQMYYEYIYSQEDEMLQP